MLEQILQHNFVGKYALAHSSLTSALTSHTDPHYHSFLAQCRINKQSSEMEKKVFGYTGEIAATALYGGTELLSRIAEMVVRGSIWSGARMLQYAEHSQHKAKIKIAGATSLAVLGIYLALPKNHASSTISNTNAYVLTVNSNNTGVLRRLGWLGRRSQDYTVFSRNWQQEANAEFGRREYGILVLTGHHGAGTDYLYGDGGEHLPLQSLPSSDTVEAVFLSACRTAANSPEVVSAVYEPLQERFPNLKIIVGFTGTSLVDDGVIPQVLMGRQLLRQESGIAAFADYALRVNPDRVGVAILKNDGSWEFRDASQRSVISYRR